MKSSYLSGTVLVLMLVESVSRSNGSSIISSEENHEHSTTTVFGQDFSPLKCVDENGDSVDW